MEQVQVRTIPDLNPKIFNLNLTSRYYDLNQKFNSMVWPESDLNLNQIAIFCTITPKVYGYLTWLLLKFQAQLCRSNLKLRFYVEPEIESPEPHLSISNITEFNEPSHHNF